MEYKPRHSANIRRLSGYSTARRNSTATTNLTSTVGDVIKDNKKNTANDDNERAGIRLPANDDNHVRVAVRCRPMSEKEISAGFESIVDFESESRIVVHDVSEQPGDQLGTKSNERRNISHVYDFDQVFDWCSKQEDVYNKAVRPLIDQVLLGFNCTVFAYGQTGTGKTHTMEGLSQAHYHGVASRKRSRGSRGSISTNQRSVLDLEATAAAATAIASKDAAEAAGIIPRTFEQIFDHVSQNPEVQFLIRASYLEIYQEEIRDLLKKDTKIKLELHERPDVGVYVKDLTSFVCKSISEIERVMRVGNQNRIVAATDMNEHSSRSHAIFMITIEQQQRQEEPGAGGAREDEEDEEEDKDTKLQRTKKLIANGRGGAVIRVGKLNLVDLAGSERQRKTNSHGQRQKESIKINLSLSALGNVINSLMRAEQQQQQQENEKRELKVRTLTNGADGKQQLTHTPYRDSKLTRLLQDSLGGNAKTLMIANIGPASYNYDETINTLNYASRARCIRNKPRVNEDPKDALLRELQQEINLLRAKLATASELSAANTQPISMISEKRSSGGGGGGVSSAKFSPQSKNSETTTTTTTATAEKKLIEKEFFELKQKLASLESKLLNSEKSDSSGKSSVFLARGQQLDHANILKGLTREQELELERRQEQLSQQTKRERAVRDELERREEAELLAKQSFASVQQEVDAKRRLIWKLLLKVKALRDEIGSAQQAYRIELDELDQLQCVLQRELKLKCLIMDNFIPNNHVDQLLSRVNYNDHRNVCTIEPIELPRAMVGNCLRSVNSRNERAQQGEQLENYWQATLGDSIRPKSEMERISEAIYPSNIRHKYEYLIEPKLTIGQVSRAASGTFIEPSNLTLSKTMKAAAEYVHDGNGNHVCRRRRPRRLCDILKLSNAKDSGNKSSGGATFHRTTPLSIQEANITTRLQALIESALNSREPDIVI